MRPAPHPVWGRRILFFKSPRSQERGLFRAALSVGTLHYFSAHYCSVMKNITLSADERLIQQAREQARAQQTTLNQLFRDWLRGLANQEQRTQEIESLFDRFDGVDSGGSFSREEMNVR